MKNTQDNPSATIVRAERRSNLIQGKRNVWATATQDAYSFACRKFSDWFLPAISHADVNATEKVVLSRPQPLRDYDQISMQAGDLVRQAKIIAPALAGKSVIFIGDNDGASAILGALAELKSIIAPSRMTVLDFDERVLGSIQSVAQSNGFADFLETRLYNVFDTVPEDLLGAFDWFYTNPPYGSHNRGESARLFITRGMECCRRATGKGCIILPDDDKRSWARGAMLETQRFLVGHNWSIEEKINHLHRYHLDDDPELASGLMLVSNCSDVSENKISGRTYVGRTVSQEEICLFYGRKVALPYPAFVSADGSFVYQNRPEENLFVQ